VINLKENKNDWTKEQYKKFLEFKKNCRTSAFVYNLHDPNDCGKTICLDRLVIGYFDFNRGRKECNPDTCPYKGLFR